MRFGDLTCLEVSEVAQAGWVAIVPTGCTEQQGPHLPVDLDTFWVSQAAEGISEAAEHTHGIGSLVAPTLPFGPTPAHVGYGSGYINLPQELHEQVLYHVLASLAAQGFRRILLLPGCKQHHLNEPVSRLNREYAGLARATTIRLPLYEIWCRFGDPYVPGGHADSFATSLALYLRAEAVRHELVRNPRHGPVDWDDPELDFSRISATGVIGDPTHASAELGAKLWAAVIDAGVQELVRFAAEPVVLS